MTRLSQRSRSSLPFPFARCQPNDVPTTSWSSFTPHMRYPAGSSCRRAELPKAQAYFAIYEPEESPFTLNSSHGSSAGSAVNRFMRATSCSSGAELMGVMLRVCVRSKKQSRKSSPSSTGKIASESVDLGRFVANEARKDRLELQGGDEAVFC